MHASENLEFDAPQQTVDMKAASTAVGEWRWRQQTHEGRCGHQQAYRLMAWKSEEQADPFETPKRAPPPRTPYLSGEKKASGRPPRIKPR